MKKYNYIILLVILVLFICFFYLKTEFEGIVIDPMSDGQAGIGKVVIWLLIIGIGIVSFIISTVTGIIIITQQNSRNKFSLFSLFLSLLLPVIILFYLFL